METSESTEGNVTVETHEVQQDEFDGVIEKRTRNTENGEWTTLRVKENQEIVYAAIDGETNANTQTHLDQIAEITESDAESVLIALADYLDYEVTDN